MNITIQDKVFVKYISQEEIKQITTSLACRINKDYEKVSEILFIVVLNGAFMFAGDLFKQIKGLHKISFIKFASYNNVNFSGEVKQLIGLNESIENKDIIIIEDIIDTGKTMSEFLNKIKGKNPKSLEICSLMFKPNRFKGNYKVKYIGKSISDEFIIGYGFDLDGVGRNLPDIYQLDN